MRQEEMKLEDLKQNFPEMPSELRMLVERKVQEQIRIVPTKRRRRHMTRKTIAAAIAAVMLLGTTAFAGIAYKMHSEPVGKYAAEIKIEEMNQVGTEENSSATGQPQEGIDIENVRMEVSYLPEGMVETEDGKYSYANALYKGGVSITFYKMDTGDAQFDMLTTNVRETEEIKVGGYDGIYCELYGGDGGDISFNQRIYVAYTDVHYVMEMYAASDVTKEDALKIAEGVHLQPVSDGNTQDIVHAYNWSEYVKPRNEETVEWNPLVTVPKSAMKNTHAVGEAFTAANVESQEDDWLGLGSVEIKVTDVQVSDKINLLDLSVMDADDRAELQKEVNQAGELLPAKINYMKYGNGIDTLDEVADSREVPQKLVYVTVEYTNIGTEKLDEILFYGSLMKIVEENGQMKMYTGAASDGSAAWDDAVYAGSASNREMWYYDVHGGERGNNYITDLKAGETATVHMAWLVPEEELGYLYLNLDTFGGSYEFSESSLDLGYVDIRQ
ncbi:MAG: DUF4367 domain-containing protein [Lachnospiraceae bacterium]|nr:DUF4367 domain-containing protein [Lachnospiraceae bacterium]